MNKKWRWGILVVAFACTSDIGFTLGPIVAIGCLALRGWAFIKAVE
jgi:hypothetical protein